MDALEAKCGWDMKETHFFNPLCSTLLDFNSREDFPLSTSEMFKLIDIVIPTARDLDFLEEWREIIEPFHLILIQGGDPEKILAIPMWADFELYNRQDIDKALGQRSWIVGSKDTSIRNFGFLASKKRFVFTLGDDC